MCGMGGVAIRSAWGECVCHRMINTIPAWVGLELRVGAVEEQLQVMVTVRVSVRVRGKGRGGVVAGHGNSNSHRRVS